GVGSIAVAGGAFYVASELKGDEQLLGSQRSANLGGWDTAGWHDASLGTNATVTSMAVADGSLYAARAVYNYNAATSASYYTSTISRLDNGVWTSLPGVFSGVVNTLASIDGSLYAGGTFSSIGVVRARTVARWDGATWTGLGDLQISEVKTLAVGGGAVYVAGITGPNQNYNVIYRWDGAAWTLLGKAYGGTIEDIAVAPNGDLYIAGQFGYIESGYTTVNAVLVARWRAGAWEALPHDFRSSPNLYPYNAGGYALEIAADGTVYLGGLFTSAGTPAMKNIVSYDGSWHALGSGVDGAVLDLELSGGDLYVGGRLFKAGGKSSSNVAIWHGGNPSAIFLPLVIR
ncbi:MAG TPA: hypothetical protein VD886_02385, partial [Herpetosiphonaceae bacterium]|nr:hypothetical protein [Herpetosiphonaceae bacterium]